MIAYAAYLRVYEPLAAMPDADRAYWAAYAEAGSAPSRAEGVAAEHAAAVRALLAVPPRPAPAAESDQAFLRWQDGRVYLCPWHTRLRCWSALAEMRRRLPDALLDAFLPRAVVDAAEADFLSWQQAHPEVRPSILTSTWHVPIPWFLAFEPAERHVELGTHRPGSAGAAALTGRALVYATPMARARQRLARTLHVLRRVLPDGAAVTGVGQLGRWLEDFHPHALVELDYGGLVHVLDDAELVQDDSVAALAEALVRLGQGDVDAAQQLYAGVALRWRRIAALEAAN